MSRISDLKKFISLRIVRDHIAIEMVGHDAREIVQLTSIKADLTEFEKDAVIVHAYKLLETTTSNVLLKAALENCNYADVFGSPWIISGLFATKKEST